MSSLLLMGWSCWFWLYNYKQRCCQRSHVCTRVSQRDRPKSRAAGPQGIHVFNQMLPKRLSHFTRPPAAECELTLPPLNGWQHPTAHLPPKAGCEMGSHHRLHWHFLTVNKAGTPSWRLCAVSVFLSVKCLFLALDLTSFQINFFKNLIF